MTKPETVDITLKISKQVLDMLTNSMEFDDESVEAHAAELLAEAARRCYDDYNAGMLARIRILR